MMLSKLNACLSLTILLLAVCAKPKLSGVNHWRPQSQIDDFNAEGRLAVRMNDKVLYANFDWSHQNQVQTINVNTPLGNTVSQLCRDKEGILAVDSKGKTFQAQTAEELSKALLGFSLPVQYLHIWVNGQWVGNAPYQLLNDGRLQQFEWTISRSLNPDGSLKILLLQSPKLTLRLVFDRIERIKQDAVLSGTCAARK